MTLLQRLFPQQSSLSWREMLFSALAAGIAISLNAWVSHSLLPGDYRIFLAASMGASTILALVVHHSPLSQPWAIVGGHLVGALSGLLAAALIPNPVLACMLAMALTVLLQIPLRCLHAPGGGTALLPILGGAALQAEGLGFVGVVLLNALLLVAIAMLFNNLLPGRRYPLAFAPSSLMPVKPVFREEDLLAALRSMEAYVDISPADLERIYEHARNHLREHHDGVERGSL
ncbi:MAG: HPP family protein [Zetaproteobacteria bacterium CG02_land_8_20_14_3_00_50_9]|nr:MAG: HPP family protein [Zetaproteobacteria bacterium CG02_land_8_20_14_3_00_50_9]